MDQPVNIARYKKRILLCVTGLSPQVVTETLYALVIEHHFIPTEIRLVTTSHGRNRVIRDLLSENGHFHAFCREYDLLDAIRFDESCIHVISDREGNWLPDIRTPEENNMAANTITDVVRRLCMDDESVLHASIAGGRKSMGFFLGYALSLFARPQDRLSHVLVSEPYENNPYFFYPSRQPRELIRHDGSLLDASQAKVMLAMIPLVCMRSGLPSSLLDGGSYTETVQAAQASILFPVELKFDLKNRTITCAGQTIRLPPAQLALMFWLAIRKKRGQNETENAICLNRDYNLIAEFLPCYKRVTPPASQDYENTVRTLKDHADFVPYFRSTRSKLHDELKKHLGPAISFFQIRSFGKRPFTCYELATPVEAIVLPDKLPTSH